MITISELADIIKQVIKEKFPEYLLDGGEMKIDLVNNSISIYLHIKKIEVLSFEKRG